MPRKTKSSPPEPAPTRGLDAQPAASPGALLGALVVAFFASLLGVYQWMELVVASVGGDLACSISARVDCAPVWGSAFAKGVAAATGMPVAAWGVVWGIAAFASSTMVLARVLRNEPAKARMAAHVARLVAIGGLVASVVLGVVSLGMVGVACPTCLFTYALVIAFFLVTRRLPGPFVPLASELARAAALALGTVLVIYLVLLVPAQRTPKMPEPNLHVPTARPSSQASLDAGQASPPPIGPSVVGDFLASLDGRGQQAVADALAAYRSAPPRATDRPPRFRLGPAGAKVEIVEWTDILCSHCATFALALDEMKHDLPPGTLTEEPRQFPLDGECNPAMSRTDGSGIRCAAALALLCLEGNERFAEVRLAMFKEQTKLTRDRVLELAAPAAGGRAQLQTCMGSDATKKKLRDDIDYALALDLKGTPLVIVNRREAPPFPAFLFALFLAQGNSGDAAFDRLPAPRPMMGDAP